MITDQTSVTARAETSNAAGLRFARGIFTTAMAASLTLPSLAASGHDGLRERPATRDTFQAISLPPIPYLDTMPWLDWNAGANGPKVDTLLSPTFDPPGMRLRPDERGSEKPATS